MPESDEKIRILLADEDALRRDGLSAVLSGSDQFEVVAQAADGEAALVEIRELRPDVAVVDLNLPKVHGIELVRRARAESLGTKIILVAGTSNDEIVREVVRAGGDGYLLKNGPARHLLDAISYVCDGGQYFSPQLHRDGRDSQLLREPVPRMRRTRRSARSTNGAVNLRQRIREDAPPNLGERDYEVMTMMADGIRPILDRLDEIDTRVSEMETGAAPVPSDPRGWLSTQLADSLQEAPAGSELTGSEVAIIGRSVNDLEARLPYLIEEAVTKRFHQMANSLQQEIEETHVRAMEAFVKNVQVKLVQRVSALENDLSKQAETMSQLRECSQRTEDNLSRLISGVDKLARELPQRLALASEQQPSGPEAEAGSGPTVSILQEDAEGTQQVRKKSSGSRHRAAKLFWASAAALTLLALVVWVAIRAGRPKPGRNNGAEMSAAAAVAPEKFVAPRADADIGTKMQAAQESVDLKDYAVAEGIYKQVVKAQPGNVDALKGLASVLYRQDKIEESAEILDRIPKN